jgi:hypothetical protein
MIMDMMARGGGLCTKYYSTEHVCMWMTDTAIGWGGETKKKMGAESGLILNPIALLSHRTTSIGPDYRGGDPSSQSWSQFQSQRATQERSTPRLIEAVWNSWGEEPGVPGYLMVIE